MCGLDAKPRPEPIAWFDVPRAVRQRGVLHDQWILILLIIAAVASLLGFPMLAGAAATGARLLIGVVLVLFLLVIFGLIAVS